MFMTNSGPKYFIDTENEQKGGGGFMPQLQWV